MIVEISFDPDKRAKTLRERGLDFFDAPEVLYGRAVSWVDDRFDYGEERWLAVGLLRGRMVVIVFMNRPAGPHIISMRKANERERAKYGILLD